MEIYIDNILHIFSYFIIIGIAQLSKDSEPNKVFGYRSKTAFKSKKNWRVLNLYFCYYLTITQNIFLILNIFFVILKIYLSEHKLFVEFSHVFLAFYVVFSFIFVIIKIKRIEKKLNLIQNTKL
ncbi:MAG: hypothetical protein DCC88_01680 [Spirobacillus cienkowskii]|uniref:SdpI family protein n=1 Tax=Spirobacillus cienkowskii TaxID=495820 RepID=A0A369KZE2_9BACT|nr:MAG: hypothetical protein DCC88_01680 [Spirobacillus cienkowskii]